MSDEHATHRFSFGFSSLALSHWIILICDTHIFATVKIFITLPCSLQDLGGCRLIVLKIVSFSEWNKGAGYGDS